MSRRITVFVLAATASLIATQAHADRECFENSCRLPEVVEPPPPAAPASVAAEDSQASANRAVHELSAEAADQPPAKPARRIEKVAAPREPIRPAPSYPKVNPIPVRETSPVREATPQRQLLPEPASYPRPARVPPMERAYANQRSGARIIEVPAPVYGSEGVGAVRPFGLYTDSLSPRLYVLAPNAKIITIDDGD